MIRRALAPISKWKRVRWQICRKALATPLPRMPIILACSHRSAALLWFQLSRSGHAVQRHVGRARKSGREREKSCLGISGGGILLPAFRQLPLHPGCRGSLSNPAHVAFHGHTDYSSFGRQVVMLARVRTGVFSMFLANGSKRPSMKAASRT